MSSGFKKGTSIFSTKASNIRRSTAPGYEAPLTSSPEWILATSIDFETDNAPDYRVQNGGTTMSYVTGADGTGRALKVTNPAVQSAGWGSQLIFDFPLAVAGQDDQYVLRMWVKASVPASAGIQYQKADPSNAYNGNGPQVNFTTEWTELEIQFTAPAATELIAFDMGLTAGDFYYDNIVLEKYLPYGTEGPPPVDVPGGVPTMVEKITGGDMESDAGLGGSFYVQNGGSTSKFEAPGADGTGRAFVATNPLSPTHGIRS